MDIINIHQAKTHLSRLVEKAARGEPFIIAKAGRPLVKVVPLDQDLPAPADRVGFMAGEIGVPDDFDRMGQKEIEALFGVDGT
ncbi:type II toxin-antitoxin system Phd/YefM family antitoxin [Marinibaculum pumilum]|uniref:Antitoxin n=1 Tax=Marinibaculum pumilum TaxID=1766165 RepID=A0ABV7L1L5_9PROT